MQNVYYGNNILFPISRLEWDSQASVLLLRLETFYDVLVEGVGCEGRGMVHTTQTYPKECARACVLQTKHRLKSQFVLDPSLLFQNGQSHVKMCLRG